MGGNFLYCRFTGDTSELIYAGEAQNLMKDARERWNEAQQAFPGQRPLLPASTSPNASASWS